MSKPGIAINLPPRVERGEAVKAADFNSIRQAVARLARSGIPDLPRIMPTTYKHPFKLFTAEEDSEIRLFVYHGAITALDWSGAAALPSFNDLNPIIGMAQTYDDPFGGTVGHLVLDVSTTYGVWIRLGRSSGTHTSTDPEFDDVLSQGFAGSAVIIADDTNIDPDDDWTYSGSYSYIFIGQVAVDAGGIATIKQHLKSDLVIPLASTLPSGIDHP
jgi:hypothetical protein